jgi:hypothetical protein
VDRILIQKSSKENKKIEPDAAADTMVVVWIASQQASYGNFLLDCLASKGSRKNKFAILGVEAPSRQGAKTPEYLDIPSFRNAAGRDASASKM